MSLDVKLFESSTGDCKLSETFVIIDVHWSPGVLDEEESGGDYYSTLLFLVN